MIRIGPSGNSERFYQEGHTKTEQAPAWLHAMGLNALEYPAGRGVSLLDDTALAIGAAAKKHGVSLSIHAPYFINCGSPEQVRREKSINYILESARAIDLMGGDRVVFHIGSPTKHERTHAMSLATALVMEARKALIDEGFEHIHLCPETMGKASQLGTLDEVLGLCKMDKSFIPTLDFGHIHTIDLGALTDPDDFRRVLDTLIDALGYERARHFHAHFSKIEFTNKGEKRHVKFSDEPFGPDFALLAPIIAEYRLCPTIICESSGSQADDALSMRQMLVESGASI